MSPCPGGVSTPSLRHRCRVLDAWPCCADVGNQERAVQGDPSTGNHRSHVSGLAAWSLLPRAGSMDRSLFATEAG